MTKALLNVTKWLGSLALAVLFFTVFTGTLLVVTFSAIKKPYTYEAHNAR